MANGVDLTTEMRLALRDFRRAHNDQPPARIVIRYDVWMELLLQQRRSSSQAICCLGECTTFDGIPIVTSRALAARYELAEHGPRIASVFVFPNGMVAVCDEHGVQMPAYQGRFQEVRSLIERDAPASTEFNGWPGR